MYLVFEKSTALDHKIRVLLKKYKEWIKPISFSFNCH